MKQILDLTDTFNVKRAMENQAVQAYLLETKFLKHFYAHCIV